MAILDLTIYANEIFEILERLRNVEKFTDEALDMPTKSALFNEYNAEGEKEE